MPRPITVPDLDATAPRAGALAQRAIPPLDAAQAQRLLEAQGMRAGGRLDPARDQLQALLAESPHHPLVLIELARVYLARQQWGQVERLGRAERAATHDSLLLGRELALALERQSKPREAAQVVMEVWGAAPAEAEWAEAALMRLDDLDPRRAREPLRRAAEARPWRMDLVRAAARLEWKRGDAATALRLLAAADATGPSTPARWTFAEERVASGGPRDTTAAVEVLLDLAADRTRAPAYRLPAARRVWQVFGRLGAEREGVVRVSRALA